MNSLNILSKSPISQLSNKTKQTEELEELSQPLYVENSSPAISTFFRWFVSMYLCSREQVEGENKSFSFHCLVPYTWAQRD